MLSLDELFRYRLQQERFIMAHMAGLISRINELRQEVIELEAQGGSTLYQALIRARTLEIDPVTCPRCAIYASKRVALEPSKTSNEDSTLNARLKCAANCGFEHEDANPDIGSSSASR